MGNNTTGESSHHDTGNNTTRLHTLHQQHNQSPWLDNIRRDWLHDGEIQAWLDKGVRGITSNPTIFKQAISSVDTYDVQLQECAVNGLDAEQTYWRAVETDIAQASELLAKLYHESNKVDGFVSVEVSPSLAYDTENTLENARELHQRLNAPNVYIKIPGTEAGVTATRVMIAERRSVNVTLLFSVERYMEIAEAYLAGLEQVDGDLSSVSSVASLFVSRVDTEIDRHLEIIGTREALALRGLAAVANAKIAYAAFKAIHSGVRWEALEARGAKPQRLLWASTSTKNHAYTDTMYVDELIGPHTVNTMAISTLNAFNDHGTNEHTLTLELEKAYHVFEKLAKLDIEMNDVKSKLETDGIKLFQTSFEQLIDVIDFKLSQLRNTSLSHLGRPATHQTISHQTR